MPARGDFAPSKTLPALCGISIGIGIIATLVAVALYRLIGFFTNLLFLHRLSFAFTSPAAARPHWVILVVPIIGGLIIGLMARYGSERIRGHGIPEALEAILFGKSKMSVKVAILKPLSSAISIGSGGPFGAEGPIIMTGGALGSLIGQMFYLTASERRTLLVAGAAAGMAATFSTPIAATMLAVELLLFEWRPRSLIPVGIACFVASALRPYFLGAGPLFPVPIHFQVNPVELGMAVFSGAFAALLSAVLTIAVYKAEDAFHKLPIHWMWWPAIGAVALAVGGYFVPHALGVGYDVIDRFLSGQPVAAGAAIFILVKGLMWAISLGSGTSGGVLAPLLMIGAGLGSIEALFFPGGTPLLWPLVSMGAVLGGVMRSPFTAIFFCLELTDNVTMLPALFIACLVSYAVSVLIMKRSILTEKVARRGFDIFREYSVDRLEQVFIREVMTKEVITVSGEITLHELAEKYFGSQQKFRGFPVVGQEGNLIGTVTRTDLLRWQGAEGAEDKRISELLEDESPFAYPYESCREVATRIVMNNLDRLPVVTDDGSLRVVGTVTRYDLLKPATYYFDEEQVRERIHRPLQRARSRRRG